jgi:hypothetical protein
MIYHLLMLCEIKVYPQALNYFMSTSERKLKTLRHSQPHFSNFQTVTDQFRVPIEILISNPGTEFASKAILEHRPTQFLTQLLTSSRSSATYVTDGMS